MTKISIITPTYNNAEYIIECIKSVQAQKVWPKDGMIRFEHIIVDDCSADNTEELVKQGNYENLQYIKLDENSGAAKARNIGIERSTGDWICLLDSDDIMLQRSIYNFANAIELYKSHEWFTSDFLHVDKNLRYILNDDYYSADFCSIQEELTSIFNKQHFIQGNVCFSKKLFHEVGEYDTNIRVWEDIDLYTRFLLNNKIDKHLNFNSHLHRHHDSNISLQISLNKREDILQFREKYNNIIKERRIRIYN